mmetsp:Transcript_25617/g.65324  ORF Transcript_25617/g.65324 Transcript_25617/m.65324 type:complete len:91 (-) Transcript_25617:9-281(-)
MNEDVHEPSRSFVDASRLRAEAVSKSIRVSINHASQLRPRLSRSASAKSVKTRPVAARSIGGEQQGVKLVSTKAASHLPDGVQGQHRWGV